MFLEVCANSYLSAVHAERGGAQRIELCTALALGGLTPSWGTITQVMARLAIPTFVLIRPRGGHFTYSDAEFEIMKQDILSCKHQGCAGVVSGILNDDYTIDLARTKTLVELADPMSFTFHRAFDWVADPHKSVRDLIGLGVQRILSSGQQTTALQGLPLLQKLQSDAGGHLLMLPGGGISPENVSAFKTAGFAEIHASGTTLQRTYPSPKLAMHSAKFFDETKEAVSNVEIIKKLREA